MDVPLFIYENKSKTMSHVNGVLPKHVCTLKNFCHYSEPSSESGGHAGLNEALSHKNIPPTWAVVTYLGLDRPNRC